MSQFGDASNVLRLLFLRLLKHQFIQYSIMVKSILTLIFDLKNKTEYNLNQHVFRLIFTTDGNIVFDDSVIYIYLLKKC